MNRELLRSGMVRLRPLGTESLTGFDWKDHSRSDKSWWQRMESCTYLLPFLDSGTPADLQFARDWFIGWYASHEQDPMPNPGSDDAMSVAIRGMVFIRMLKIAESGDTRDVELTTKLRRSIKWHQSFLADSVNASERSNHALWEALGLFETTRVIPDSSTTELALERLRFITDLSVSDMGTHLEHSTDYHFYFLNWLTEFVEYFQALAPFESATIQSLSEDQRKMASAARYLYAHDYELPQIGDTDAGHFADERWRGEVDEPVFFDREGGYAIYKGIGKDRRYVAFCIQNFDYEPVLPFHFHNDVLAVYLNIDGEVILGDQGRFSYERTIERTYLMSLAAHNVIFPKSIVIPKTPGIYLAKRVSEERSKNQVRFGAALRDDIVRRTVRIPDSGPIIVVEDTITAKENYYLLWHLGTDVADIKEGSRKRTADRRDYKWMLTMRSGREFELRIRIEGRNLYEANEVTIIEGQQRPRLGWRSAAYKQFEPSPVIKLEFQALDMIRITTSVRHKRNFWQRLFGRDAQ
ncbi:MAG: heparinase II/III family protein [bacterium]|nr:heparinase II/III family protein [bacterium]